MMVNYELFRLDHPSTSLHQEHLNTTNMHLMTVVVMTDVRIKWNNNNTLENFSKTNAERRHILQMELKNRLKNILLEAEH